MKVKIKAMAWQTAMKLQPQGEHFLQWLKRPMIFF